MSREEFQTYWRGTHVLLVTEHAAALGIKRYVQVHTLPTEANVGVRASRGAPEGFDGIAEAWYDSYEAATEAFGSEAGRAAWKVLRQDERAFIDLERSPIFFGEEHLVFDDA
jgi:uncharacterized protein (TIGR02118 family)